jgi:hypothetical protein
MEESIFVDDEL